MMDNKKKSILITGGSGFIGRNLIEHLQGKYRIVAPTSKELDLLDEVQVNEFLKNSSFDVVIHCAKKDDVKDAVTDYEVLDSNLRMFYNLVKCSPYYGKMLYFGSGAEYDRGNMQSFVTEDTLGDVIPTEPYGFSKYIMADKAENTTNIYDLCLFGVYGKYEAWHRRFISNAICRSLHGLPITLQKNVYFDYLYMPDLCRIISLFIENDLKHKRYNVCRGEHIDLYTLAKMVKGMTNNPYEIQVAEEGFKTEYSGSNKRMLDEFPHITFTPFEEAIRELIEYYKKHLDEIDITLL